MSGWRGSYRVKTFARSVWRRIPPWWREACIHRLTALFVPAAGTDLRLAEPIVVVGFLRDGSGLGAAARASYAALQSAGLDVYGIDVSEMSAARLTNPNFAFRDGRKVIGCGTILLHVSASRVALALLTLGRAVVREKIIVGHWFWELPVSPPSWRSQARLVHEIWVNASFVADAVRDIADGRPIRVMPYPLLADENASPPKPQPSAKEPFVVLAMFAVTSNFARKNPCAAVNAFRRAFGDDPGARLIVKYAGVEAWPQSQRLLEDAAAGASNIELIEGELGQDAIDRLYEQADVVLSLHRSEGLGLVVAEAMMHAIPVVATGWSATAEFVDETCGVAVGYRLVPVDDPQGVYQGLDAVWAEADVDEAAAALRRLRDDPELRARLGEAARERVGQMFSYARYVAAVKGRMTDTDAKAGS